MAGALRHRGPDESGVYRDGRAGLAHVRLSIIDLSTGQQPLSNEDGSLWIVFNGEIYNYLELRTRLEGLGHVFRTRSDTEVVVHAFEAWGDACFALFNGQWALALWDTHAQRLTLSRDRIGVRPLFVCEQKGRLAFGSEVKALFADPSIPRRIDLHGLDQTFTYWACLSPVSFFQGIQEIPEGSIRTYDRTGVRKERKFWRPTYTVRDGSSSRNFPKAVSDLRARLEEATSLRMLRADVPVGSYLSGGLDSSVIAGLGRKAAHGDFRTFSVRFEDAEFDETKFQRLMVSTLGSAHEELVVRRGDIARVFPDVIRHAERPLLRTAAAPLFLLSALVRESGIKAVLTGEGADEMLAGYDLFREAKIREFWSRQPESMVRPRLFDRLYPYLARSPRMAQGMAFEFWKRGLDRSGLPGFSHEPRWRTTSLLKKFLSADVRDALKNDPSPDVLGTLPDEFRGWDSLAQAQYLEVVTLLSSYLISSQGDRMLMAHSVEGRFPFLDPDVMEFCNGLPPEFKLIGLNEKYILKKMARDLVPEEIIMRPKQPYRAPDAVCFVEPGAPEYVEEAFSEKMLKETSIFDANAVSSLYAKCCARVRERDHGVAFSNADNMAIVGILSTQLAHEQFIQKAPGHDAPDIRFDVVVDRAQVYTQ